MAENLNQRIGDYEILGVLGAGGMGKVYRVRNVISDRVEAMKILLPSLSDHREVGERFLREIKLVASLHHPNIANLCTAQTLENHLVMVMEFVDGDTFSDLLDRGALSLQSALNYFDQALAALAYAHAKGIVHRDIKPSNIMLTPEGVVKLMDFGIARNNADRALTQTGATIGTASYMSPEQIAGKATDGRSDLYSMGIFLYETVTGEQPFKGSSDYEVMAAHINQAPRPPIEFVPDVPAALNDIVLRLLAKSPADRFQSAEEAREAIHKLREFDSAPRPLPKTAAGATARSATVVEGMGAPTTLMTTLMAPQPVGTLAHNVHPERRMTEVSGMQTYASSPSTALAVPKKSLARQPAVYAGAAAVVGMAAFGMVFAHRNADTKKTDAAPVVITNGGSPPANPPGGSGDKKMAVAPVPLQKHGGAGLPPAPNAGMAHAQNTPPSGATPVAPGKVVVVAGATAATPAISPELKAKLDEAETQIDQVDARAGAINNSLNTMQRSMQKDGLSLRGDIAGKQAGMNTSIAKAKQALASHDADRASRFAAQAQTDANDLESFLGR